MNHLLTWLVSWSYSVSYSWYVLNVFFLGCILLVFITCFLFGLYPPGIYNLFSFWVVSSWSLSSIIFLGCILLVFIVCVLFGLYPPGIYRLFSFWVVSSWSLFSVFCLGCIFQVFIDYGEGSVLIPRLFIVITCLVLMLLYSRIIIGIIIGMFCRPA